MSNRLLMPALVACFFVSMLAVHGHAAPGTAPMAGTGVITGTVTNANTGTPIASAVVTSYDCIGSTVTVVATNASGVYTSSASLETGTYFALASKAGFAPELYSNVLFPINGDVTVGSPVSVTSGATTGSINFSLAAASAFCGISGTVTNAGTAAAVGTTVDVFDAVGSLVESTTSDAGTGAYATSIPLKTGTYHVYAFGTGGLVGEFYNNMPCMAPSLCNPTASTPISVTAGSVKSGINLGLNAGGRIAGTVTAASGGTPLAASVSFYNSASNLVGAVTTDGTGAYLSDNGLAGGVYYVRIGGTTDE